MTNRFNPHQHPMQQPGEGNQAQSFFYHPASAQQQQQVYQGYPQGFPPLHLMAPQQQVQFLQTLNEAQRRQALQQQQQQQHQEMKNRAAGVLSQQQQQQQQHPGFTRLSAAELLLLQQQQQQQQQNQERELRQRLGFPEGALLANYGGNTNNATAANNFLANITLAQMRQQQQQQQYQQQLSQLQSQQQQQQQQSTQQQQQQQLAALMATSKTGAGAAAPAVGMGGTSAMMLLPSAAGPHLDPAIAAASPAMQQQQQQQPGSTAVSGISSTAPAAATSGAPPATGPAPGATGPAAATAAAATATGKGKIEVEDEYGLKQLVKVVQPPLPMSATPYVPSPDEPTDPASGRPISQQEADELNFTFITRGVDITQIGLSVTEEGWLHTTLATLPLDSYEHYILPEFKIPDSYKKPRPKSLSMKSFHQFKEETLFYIFYSMPRDVLHLAAARALYERGWRYNKRAQHWLHPVKAEDGSLMEKTTAGMDGEKIFTGTYTVFQPNEWKQVRTQPNHVIAAADIEEQSALVAAMEEAARQQSQRARAKAAHGAGGGGGAATAGSNSNNGSMANNSPPSAGA
ncbi:CCR4-NOT transcription complex subunit 2, putative [Leishmania guyanensis]